MSSVPRPRRFHFSAGRNRSTFYWGGETLVVAEGKYVPAADLEYLYELDIAELDIADNWKKYLLKGQHPSGVSHGACAVDGDCLYLYGGIDKEGELTGSLFELNLSTKSWRELSHPGTGGPKKKQSCGMVAYNSTLIIYGGLADDGPTNELHVFDLKAGTWSSPCVTGDVPPPDYGFTFTYVSNHHVVLRGGVKNKDTYVLDLSMHWEKHQHSGPEVVTGHDLAAACLGQGSDHAQLLMFSPFKRTSPWLLDVATWKWMEMKLPDDLVFMLLEGSATAIQTSPTSVEVVVYGKDLVRLKFKKRPSALKDVSPVQWWILTEAKGRKFEVGDVTGTELSKPTADLQTSSNTPKNTREGQAVSVSMPDAICTSSSEVQCEKTSKEIDEVAAQSENIDATVSEQGFVSDVIQAVDQNQQIQMKMANIILKGLPEAGKSTLLNRLLKRPFRKSYSSTGLSDGIVVVDIQPTSTLSSATATSDNSSWDDIDFDASMYSQLEDSKQFLPSAEEKHIKKNNSNNSPSYQVCNVSNTSEVSDSIKKVLKAHNVKSIKDLKMKNKIFLYIRDTGGLVEFQESLTLLIHGPSIIVFVLRTDIDIYKKNIICYRAPSGEIINRYQSSISTVDALIQVLTSVSAIDTTIESVFQEGGVYHMPVVFIVGTHIDQLKSRASSVIAETNERLDELIRHHNFSKVVRYANLSYSKVMYTVDNTSVKDYFLKVFRRDVNNFIGSRSEFTVLYPVSYLLSCLELQSIKDTVISMNKFMKLASKFNICTSNQVNHLLQFLHFRIGIIQHYDVDNLSEIVIKEPQVLFNKVTDLLVKTFLTGEAMNNEEQTSFFQKGILEASSFEMILGESNDKITAKQFLAFMVHLRLAVSFIDKNGIQKYFVPLVLNHVPNSSGEERKTDIAPLCICFQLGHCPQGLFGVLISQLVNPEESYEFSFDFSEDKIYQDQVSLLVSSLEDVDEISLKRHLSHIEVTMYIEGSFNTESESLASRNISPTTVCTTVRKILQDCLRLSLKILLYDIQKLQPMFCLRCPESNCPVKIHEVITGKKNYFMYCKFYKRKHVIPLSGVYWFKGEASNTAEGWESTSSQEADVVTSVITKDGGESKTTANLRIYLSSIQEKYQENLEEQIDQEIVYDIAKTLQNWEANYDLLKLDLDEVKVIKEKNSSVLSQRVTALNRWKNRVGQLGTYRNLLRILALGKWHDSAKKIITFINNGSHHKQISCSSGSQQLERRSYFTPGQKRYLEQSESFDCLKHPRIMYSTSDTEFDRNFPIISGFSAEVKKSVLYKGENISCLWEEASIQMTFQQSKEFHSQEASMCFVQISDTAGSDSILPNNAEAVSRYYHISSSKNLNTAVTLKIFYRTAECNTDELYFLTSTDMSPPYNYQILRGGHFTSTYGEITVKTFSFYIICRLYSYYGIRGVLAYIMETKYKASLYCSNQPTPQSRWNIYLVVVNDYYEFSNSAKTYIQDNYNENVTLVTEQVVFLSDNVGCVTVKHKFRNSPKNLSVYEPDHHILNHADIKEYVNGRPPLLKYSIGCSHSCSFNLRFTLDGVQVPKYLTLRESDLQAATASCSTVGLTQRPAKNFSILNLTLLKWTDDEDQIQRLRLRDELCSKWRDAGILLGVSSGRLNGIFTYRLGDLQLCCSDVLLEWLQKAEMSSYSASWDGLLDLLEDLELIDVATKLRMAIKFMK